MTTILIIEKPGNIRELKVKIYAENELFKKAGFKSPEGFNIHANWNFPINDNNYSISLYGKTNGKAGQENKYDFPPPADKKLFFGACVLTGKCNDTVCDLTSEIWEKAYEHLFGGFEDLEDEEKSEDGENNIPKTKSGYAKDGFVVDDEDMEEEYKEVSKKNKNKKRKINSIKKPSIPPAEEFDKMEVLDCTDELEEEEYI